MPGKELGFGRFDQAHEIPARDCEDGIRLLGAKFGRKGAVVVSLALGCLYLAAGQATLPRRDMPATWSYHLPADRLASEFPTLTGSAPVTHPTRADTDGPLELPVYIMRGDRSTLRAGMALVNDRGQIDVSLYDPSDPQLIQGSEAVLFNADFRVLWLLAAEADRARLHENFTELSFGVRDTVDAMLRSPEFINEYRPALKDISLSSVTSAWNDPTTRVAYDEFIRAAEPVLRDTVERDLKAIVTRRAEPAVWEMLSANVGALMTVFLSPSWDTTPLEQALDDIQREIRDRGLLTQAASRLLDSWQAREFIRVFAGNVMDSLAADPRTKDVLGRLITDDRLAGYLGPASGPAARLARRLPDVLFGIHPSTDLNAIAAYSFRSFLTGEANKLVILMSPQHRDEMLRLDRRSPRVLMHGAPA